MPAAPLSQVLPGTTARLVFFSTHRAAAEHMGHESSKIMQASFAFGSVMCTTYAHAMSKVAMIALKIEIDRAKNLFASLNAEQWAAQSGCTDWRVQDVACHMASVFHQIADPATIDGGNGEDAEVDAEVPVQARKNWTPLQVMAEYNELAEKGFAALNAMQEEPTASMVIPMANLGSHPLHILGNAIVFDHYCHLRHDIGHAIPAAANLPRDDAALSAALVWMLAGTPEMCARALASCTVGVNLVFEGPAAGSYAITPPASGTGLWSVVPEANPAFASATGTAHDFVSWATKRANWSDHVTLSGNSGAQAGAAATLDALNII
jgi:uncharacterized protein (TIGR03083 family)